MQILENNFKDSRKIECSSCKSVLLVSNDDIHGSGNDQYIICPCCNAHIFINFPDQKAKPPYTCEECGNNFDAPTYIGAYGFEYSRCPHCNNEQIIDDGVDLTPDNIQYPTTFHKYDGKNIEDKEINEWVKECLDNINKDVDYTLHAGGDTIVVAFKSDEDYKTVSVIVAKNYQECEVVIPDEKF